MAHEFDEDDAYDLKRIDDAIEKEVREKAEYEEYHDVSHTRKPSAKDFEPPRCLKCGKSLLQAERHLGGGGLVCINPKCEDCV